MDPGIKRLNVNGKAKVQMSTRELKKPKGLQKKNQRLIIRSGGSARAWMRVLGVVLARASFGVSSVVWSEFRGLHLIVSVRDWSTMFARDGEE